ncbi:MAG TPA: acyl carrier protein [Candidatus Limnocylindrales bacterium]
MERQTIVDRITEALSEVLKRDVSGATEDTRLIEDLQMDSTSVLELLMAVEDTLGFEVDPENLQMDDFKTVGTLADHVGAALDVAV